MVGGQLGGWEVGRGEVTGLAIIGRCGVGWAEYGGRCVWVGSKNGTRPEVRFSNGEIRLAIWEGIKTLKAFSYQKDIGNKSTIGENNENGDALLVLNPRYVRKTHRRGRTFGT